MKKMHIVIIAMIIVVVIMFVLSNYWYELFFRTTSQLSDVGDDIKNQMITELRRSNASLTLEQEDITIVAGNSRERYFGVKNHLQIETSFDIATSCDSENIEIMYFNNTRSLGNGEIDVNKIQITVSEIAEPTTWPCELILSNNGTEYAKKSFFITVE